MPDHPAYAVIVHNVLEEEFSGPHALEMATSYALEAVDELREVAADEDGEGFETERGGVRIVKVVRDWDWRESEEEEDSYELTEGTP